ncbi:MAG: FAD-linked oxidase C-terminal domain-containing protein [Flavobacteriales bacterium]
MKAHEAVSAVFRAGITPSALEFMERDAIDFTLKHMPEIELAVPDEVQAHLLVEVDGDHADVLMRDCETILGVMEAHGWRRGALRGIACGEGICSGACGGTSVLP